MNISELIELLKEKSILSSEEIETFVSKQQRIIAEKQKASSIISEKLVGAPSNRVLTKSQFAIYERIMNSLESCETIEEIQNQLNDSLKKEKLL